MEELVSTSVEILEDSVAESGKEDPELIVKTEEIIDEETSTVDNNSAGIGQETTQPNRDEDAAEETTCPVKREELSKFQRIVSDHLNGEVVNSLDDVTRSVLSSYTLAGFLDHAMPVGKEIIITKLHQYCCSSLQNLLQIDDGTYCYIHEEPASGIIQLIQMQLLNLYPKYSTQGYEALYSCPPTIYISTLCLPTLGSVISRKLGLPSSCIKVVKMSGQSLSKLDKLLQEDLAAKRVPVMIVASIGSYNTGEADDLIKVTQLSQRFKTWLHLEGHLISHLGFSKQTKQGIQVADSLNLDLRQWLGIPSIPFVTMYRHCETALQRAASLTPVSSSPFTVVPLWFALQSVEIADVNSRFQTAFELSKKLVQYLSTFPNVKIMSHIPKQVSSLISSESMDDDSEDILDAESTAKNIPESIEEPSKADEEPQSNAEQSKIPEEGILSNNQNADGIDGVGEAVKTANVAEEMSQSLNGDIEVEELPTVEKDPESQGSETVDSVVDEAKESPLESSISSSDTVESAVDAMSDQLVEPNPEELSKAEALMQSVCPVVVFQYRPKKKGNRECSPNLLDDLNLWLVQVLERASNDVHIDIIDVEKSGYALRFSPYDCKTFPTMEQLEQFFECFNQQMEILNATVEHKGTLVQVVESSDELQLVELPGWAGLGGVRYLPGAWRSQCVDQLPDQGKKEINKINQELVARLKITDSAFSIGEGKDGLSCVRFGMVVAVTDVTALANLVRQTGLEIEASTLALETMAVMVRKGIEEAQAELQKENEQQLWQQGLLRHIPVVGSLVNYFSPPQRNSVKGRTMNLQNGKIEKSDIVIQQSPVAHANHSPA